MSFIKTVGTGVRPTADPKYQGTPNPAPRGQKGGPTDVEKAARKAQKGAYKAQKAVWKGQKPVKLAPAVPTVMMSKGGSVKKAVVKGRK